MLVPFRSRREIGICLGEAMPPEHLALKPLLAVLDSAPRCAALLETGDGSPTGTPRQSA
jgi:hypothetical protein